MDELEMRRQLMSEPNSKDPKLNEYINSDVKNQDFTQQMRNLEQKLEHAVNVKVPDGLADRIILKQSFDDENSQQQKRNRWHLAMAASLSFVIGFGVSQFEFHKLLSPSIGSIALAHVQHELPFTQDIDENATLTTINAKLVKYGLNMNTAPKHVYYVNHCHYHNQPALHMIVQGATGKVTLFVVPEADKLKASDYFADGQLKGKVIKLQNASMVLVGDKNEPLKQLGEELSQSIQAKWI